MTKNETWNIDDLIALTETVQTGEVDYQGKKLLFQYCELTEGEEPKLELPPESASEDVKNEVYQKVGLARIKTMVDKANKKNPDGATITLDNWDMLPSTVRWGISQAVLGGGSPNFRDVDDTVA
jgi:nitric oxide reductase activation protein